MSNPVAALRSWTDSQGRHGRQLLLWCPGCEDATDGFGLHGVEIDDPEKRWGWNGDLTSPTVHPSILVTGTVRCHSFVAHGQWEYLADCEHCFAGGQLDLPELPDWVLGESDGGGR